MKYRFKRVLAGVAGIAALAGIVPVAMATPASAAPNFQGTADITPNSSADSTAPFTMSLPAGAKCPGDSANDGWRVTSYLVSKDTDPTTLTFNSDGPTSPQFGPPQSTFRQPLYDSSGSPYSAAQTAAEDPEGSGGNIINVPQFTFGIYDASVPEFSLPAGQYNIGIACVNASGPSYPIDRFWNNTITVSSNPADPGTADISWVEGTPANAPTATSASPGNGQCTVAYTGGGSAPADVSYTATATPGAFTASDSAEPFDPITITGLTNGTEYTITVTANNGVGDSPASNSLTCTPQEGARTNVTNVSVTAGSPGSGTATVVWTTPAPNGSGVTPSGCDVVVDGPVASTATPPCDDQSHPLSGLTPGNYTVQVTAKYATAPTSGTVPSTTTVAFTVVGSGLPGELEQEITVTRPQGALVLTQVCGVHGAIPTLSGGSVAGFPDALPAATDDGSHVGAPVAGGTAPLLEDGTPDSRKPQYPYPVNADGTPDVVYPTTCALDLGNARFVTRGAGAGQYFAAEGILHQVSVVDTRDNDTGWTVTGKMGNFTKAGDSFDGGQLGWDPTMTEDTGPFVDSTGATYDQTVVGGDLVHPRNPSVPTSEGLKDAKTLAKADSGKGLGTAILDGRLLLLIPVTADAGGYTGTLIITATAP